MARVDGPPERISVELLRRQRSTPVTPGANLRGAVAGAAWIYLLPTLEPGHVLVVGRIGEPSLQTLAGIARSVEVRTDGLRAAQEAVRLARRDGLDHVAVLVRGRPVWGASSSDPIDLVVAPGLDPTALTALLATLRDDLAPDASVYLEVRGPMGAGARALADLGFAVAQDLDARFGGSQLLLAMVPRDPALVADLTGRGLLPTSDRVSAARFGLHVRVNACRVQRTTRSILRSRRLPRLSWRLGAGPKRAEVVVLRRTDADASEYGNLPPNYLRAMASGAGLDLETRRWAFAARGEYNTQKPVFLLYEPGGDAAVAIVKATRDVRFGVRLEAERDALRSLESYRWRTARVPRVLFDGHHGSFAFLAETVLDGRPFERVANPGRPDPWLDAAIDFFVELAQSTARPALGRDHAEALRPLVERFLELWVLPDHEAATLRGDLETLAAAGALPAVFVHGDPGTWNLLAQADGRIGVLDWEAAEEAGPPMWDLVRLVHSYAALDRGSARFGGAYQRAAAHLVDGSPLTPTLAGAFRRYRDALELPTMPVPALVRLAWLCRALKEANRLGPADLDRGHHARLLRRLLSRPDAPGWRRITGGDGGPA